MADIMEIIKQRRSIRKFQEKPVPEEVLSDLLDAVKWSPSWANTQCWEVVVVKDPGVREKLQATLAPKNPASPAVVKAPVLLAVCGKLKSSGFYKDIATTRLGDWFMFDLGIATQSICLAAQDRGLGSVIIGAFDQDKANDAMKIPEGYATVVLIPLGYPDQSPSAPKRRDISDFVHTNTF